MLLSNESDTSVRHNSLWETVVATIYIYINGDPESFSLPCLCTEIFRYSRAIIRSKRKPLPPFNHVPRIDLLSGGDPQNEAFMKEAK